MQNLLKKKRQDFQTKLRSEFLEAEFRRKRKNPKNLNYYTVREIMDVLPTIIKTQEIDKMIKGHENLLESADSTMLLENNYLNLALDILKDLTFYDCYPLIFDLLYGLSLDLQCFNQDMDLILNIVDESFNILKDDLQKQTENIYKILELFLSLMTNNNQCCEYIISNNIIELLLKIQLNWPNLTELHKLITSHVLIIFERNSYLINELKIIIENYFTLNYNEQQFYLLLFIIYKSKELEFSEVSCRYIFDFNEIPKTILIKKLKFIQELLFYQEDQYFLNYTNSQAQKFLKFSDFKLKRIGYKILSQINYKMTPKQQQSIVKEFNNSSESEREVIISLLNKDFMTGEEIQTIFEICIDSDSEFLILKSLELLDLEQLTINKDLIYSLDLNYIKNEELIEKLENINIYFQYY